MNSFNIAQNYDEVSILYNMNKLNLKSIISFLPVNYWHQIILTLWRGYNCDNTNDVDHGRPTTRMKLKILIW